MPARVDTEARGQAAGGSTAAVAEAQLCASRWRYGRAAGWTWLLFLGFPLAELLGAHAGGLRIGLVLAGLFAFLAAYWVLLLQQRVPLSTRVARALVFCMFAIGVALSVLDRGGWAAMLIYTVVAMSRRGLFTERVALGLVFACTGTVAALLLLAGAALGAVISLAVTCAGVGLLVISIGQLSARNAELLRARDERARLAVAEERLRFARDLHDLLGHSLSVIALKAELAGRLMEHDVEAAAAHVSELEHVARGALKEVRDAVSGYRTPVLRDEVDGARLALAAAGIEASVERPELSLSPEVEALLAWTVREGATNVIRHSGAGRCAVTVSSGDGLVGVEVRDDGSVPMAERQGDAVSGTRPGHGIAGLRERAEHLSGNIEAGPAPDGGFQLRVSVPLGPLGESSSRDTRKHALDRPADAEGRRAEAFT